ncbi:MAG: mandelate racemase/muconate lactonizing enzyme family protein [Armatimonadetes bacterium]|nr:mandelate racemase/muconate lactonizing enzyme family protein [Armatimonadota bacterium]MDW8122524.1 mandelate racemase/muconate lactonizing enzyme family protein [Armatimonadota bacterium]
MVIEKLEMWVVEMKQRPPVAPYTHRGSGKPGDYQAGQWSTTSLLVKLTTDTGIVGWGETVGVDPKELPTMQETWSKELIGTDPFQLEEFYLGPLRKEPAFKSAAEMALWDIIGKACGQPVCRLLGGVVREKVPVAACMGIRSYEEAGKIAQQYVEMGFHTLKTKAGRDPEEDLEMVRGIRDRVGNALQLRIDANQGYSFDVALALCRRLEPYRLQYFEQPCPADALDEMAELRRATKVPIAVNESVGDPETVPPIIEKRAADVLMPDTPQSGGVWAVKKIAHIAEASRLTCVMHCGHDLGIKTAAMLHIAASSPTFRYGNDTTYYSMEDDVLKHPFQIVDGFIEVPLSPGLGIEVDEEKVHRYAIVS